MLSELLNVRQFKNEGHRRWFSDNYFDLIVWYDDAKAAIAGFQLCYDRTGRERAVTWRKERGFSHNCIDEGEGISVQLSKMSPILASDGEFSKEAVGEKFKAASSRIDAEIADFVYAKISAYPGTTERSFPSLPKR
jgi:hypothetical protein